MILWKSEDYYIIEKIIKATYKKGRIIQYMTERF